MIDKCSIYTKTGDKGETSLVSGTRIKKSDLRIDLYGEVDELNSYIGIVAACLKQTHASTDTNGEISTTLQKIQRNLFVLGSLLACESDKRIEYKLNSIDDKIECDLENIMDDYNSKLPPLSGFILPGGSIIAASTHVCRTICRRLERKMISFKETDGNHNEIPENALRFINRLSDYFFMLARYFSFQDGIKDMLWHE